MQKEESFEFRKSLFWDAKLEEMSLEVDASLIIQRVLERGNTEEWQKMKAIYGLEKIRLEALNARYLTRETLCFCSVYFSEPEENFRSWQTQMQHPEHLRWIY
jgi:hypothetical protein